VKGEKGTVELTGYLKMRKIATADAETALAQQIEELKLTLENVKAKEDLELEWRRFNGISMPKKPREKSLGVIHTVIGARKKQLEQQVKAYLEKNTIPADFLTENALEGLLEEAEKEVGTKYLDEFEKLRDYNGLFEAILSQFNETAKSDFFGDIVPKKSDPLDFYPGVAKFVFKANLNRPIEF
jgi:hypothetical protein